MNDGAIKPRPVKIIDVAEVRSWVVDLIQPITVTLDAASLADAYALALAWGVERRPTEIALETRACLECGQRFIVTDGRQHYCPPPSSALPGVGSSCAANARSRRFRGKRRQREIRRVEMNTEQAFERGTVPAVGDRPDERDR